MYYMSRYWLFMTEEQLIEKYLMFRESTCTKKADKKFLFKNVISTLAGGKRTATGMYLKNIY